MIPQKRHTALQPLSREHHQALLLCWKLRQGFSLAVDPDRMLKYAGWFWKSYLAPHFHTEETKLFPILGNDHPGVQKALKQHKELYALFHSTAPDTAYTLRQIAFELEQHIRFEERDLFNDIQAAAGPDQLELIATSHKEEKFEENIEDMFWVAPKPEKPAAPPEKPVKKSGPPAGKNIRKSGPSARNPNKAFNPKSAGPRPERKPIPLKKKKDGGK